MKTAERGIIPVNEHFQKNIENIYAAGDVIGFPTLASTSMEQARRAVHHALGLGGSAISYLAGKAGRFTYPRGDGPFYPRLEKTANGGRGK